MSRAQVALWLNSDKPNASAHHLIRLSEVLDCSIYWLQYGLLPGRGMERATVLTEEEHDLIDLYREIPDPGKARVLREAREMHAIAASRPTKAAPFKPVPQEKK